MINKRFKEYFTFTKKERNGIIVLLLVSFGVILVNIYINHKSFGKIILTNVDFDQEVIEFKNSLEQKEEKNEFIKDYKKTSEPEWKNPDILFDFDPNTCTEKDLYSLGFSEKQIKTINNFRKKGGKFYKNEDLLKIYGLSETQYKILEPYVKIQNDEQVKTRDKLETYKLQLVNVNLATKDELVQLKGVGDSYAERIIKYRELLGGFYSVDQLLEVYGMDSTRFINFKDQVQIDTSGIKQINLNTAGFKTLIKHPYLNKYQTEAILKYKELSGEFKSVDEILDNNLLDEERFYKIKPYLKIETK